MNPTFDRKVIERAMREDPVAAASEYGTAWRKDITTFISLEALAAITTPGVSERPPQAGLQYRAFLDFAGGSGGDSAALGIAHTDPRTQRDVLDLVREAKPPFSPAAVCEQFAHDLRRYRITTAVADRWGSQFVVEAMRAHGISVEQSAKSKSEIYLELLPRVMSKLVEWLDDPRLTGQATSLERRPSGVDHGPRGKDDVVNAAAGALVSGRVAHEYHIGVIGVCGHHEARAQAKREAAARERELEQLVPRAVRGDATAALDWFATQEPRATVEEIAEVWRGFHAAGVLPAWTDDLHRLAEARLKGLRHAA
jgi:hypothetical protein